MTRITISGRNCDISRSAFQSIGRGLALLGGPAEAVTAKAHGHLRELSGEVIQVDPHRAAVPSVLTAAAHTWGWIEFAASAAVTVLPVLMMMVMQ